MNTLQDLGSWRRSPNFITVSTVSINGGGGEVTTLPIIGVTVLRRVRRTGTISDMNSTTINLCNYDSHTEANRRSQKTYSSPTSVSTWLAVAKSWDANCIHGASESTVEQLTNCLIYFKETIILGVHNIISYLVNTLQQAVSWFLRAKVSTGNPPIAMIWGF